MLSKIHLRQPYSCGTLSWLTLNLTDTLRTSAKSLRRVRILVSGRCDQYIWNLERCSFALLDHSQNRYPPGNEKHIPPMGKQPENHWLTIGWLICDHSQSRWCKFGEPTGNIKSICDFHICTKAAFTQEKTNLTSKAHKTCTWTDFAIKATQPQVDSAIADVWFFFDCRFGFCCIKIICLFEKIQVCIYLWYQTKIIMFLSLCRFCAFFIANV